MNEFAKIVKEILESAGYDVETDNKAYRGVSEVHITVKLQDEVNPSFRTSSLMETFDDASIAAEYILNLLMSDKLRMPKKAYDPYNYKVAKKHLRPILCNEKYVDKDVFKVSAEGNGFEDLYIAIQLTEIINEQPEHAGFCYVSNNLIEAWKVSKTQIIEDALLNYAPKAMLRPLSSVLEELTEIPEENFDSPLMIANYGKSVFGASAILLLRKELDKRYPEGYYVLPSSVHEVLIIDKSLANADFLVTMVKDVNTSVLDQHDILSNSVYEF